MCVLDFGQGRFHNMSPGDFESTFIKAGDSETKGGLTVEEVTGESLGRVLLWLRTNVRKGASLGGAAVSSLEVGEKSRWSCRCPLLPWLQVSWGPLESRKR